MAKKTTQCSNCGQLGVGIQHAMNCRMAGLYVVEIEDDEEKDPDRVSEIDRYPRPPSQKDNNE
jgi:hypothetical protein